ncbi:hypothetical protein GCM10009760_60080 [Kitasatospora kazusensis]|uniref:Thioesterase domain-containing protein n=1 Tax=Kitasatospora kazusensis TaxID=407974 RepID=A0ABN3AAY6_9ACTN
MAESGSWKTLVEGGGSGGIVLAVDFDTTGRPEARFSDLVANLRTDLAVWETVPPAAGSEYARSGAGYVDCWAQRLEAERPQIKALLGFCAGSVYAAALAERIASWQQAEPLLVIFDPEVSVSQTLMWQYHKVVGFMSSVISDEDVATAREAGLQLHNRTPEIGPLKDGLIRLIREIGEPAFTRVGLDEARREELFSVFESFLCYLAAASDIDPLDRWRSAVAFSSASPLSGLRAMRASGVGGDRLAVAREIEIDVEHGSMLADKGLAEAVSELLNG